jgi:hypothetical protein
VQSRNTYSKITAIVPRQVSTNSGHPSPETSYGASEGTPSCPASGEDDT